MGLFRGLPGILLSALLMFGLVGAPQATPVASSQGLAVPLSSGEARVIELVNAERAKVGLAPLTYNGALALSASRYAAYMASANFFGHVGPDGSTLVTRNLAAGYGNYTFMGENLAAGQSTPEAAIAGWMGSPGHRANILSASAKEIGVGHASGGTYGHYWVQEFGARPAAPVAAPAPAPAPKSAPASPPPAPRTTAPSARGTRPAAVPPAIAPAASWTSANTGFTVLGEWLAAFRALGGLDNLGEPHSEIMADPAMGGRTAQYFQRAVLDFHPENAAPYRIQRRLLGDLLYPSDDPVSPDDAPPGPATHFPFSPDRPTGLGHFVADYTRSGEAIYFKEHFDRHGGVDVFGYPKEEPKRRDGFWTQRFQAAVFVYHPANDRDGLIPGTSVPYRNYRVQLALLGDEYRAALEAQARAARNTLGTRHAPVNLQKDIFAT